MPRSSEISSLVCYGTRNTLRGKRHLSHWRAGKVAFNTHYLTFLQPNNNTQPYVVTSWVTWHYRSRDHYTRNMFYWVVNLNQLSVSHGCRDTKPQKFCGDDLDLLESRDVIFHMAVGHACAGGRLKPSLSLTWLLRYRLIHFTKHLFDPHFCVLASK